MELLRSKRKNKYKGNKLQIIDKKVILSSKCVIEFELQYTDPITSLLVINIKDSKNDQNPPFSIYNGKSKNCIKEQIRRDG